jgi:hypothetical protein
MDPMQERVEALEMAQVSLNQKSLLVRRRLAQWRGAAGLLVVLGLAVVPLKVVGAPPDSPNLTDRVAQLEQAVAALQTQVNSQAAQITALQTKLAPVSVTSAGTVQLSGGLIINGGLVQGANGENATFSNTVNVGANLVAGGQVVAGSRTGSSAELMAVKSSLTSEATSRQTADANLQSQIDPLTTKLAPISVTSAGTVALSGGLIVNGGLVQGANGENASFSNTVNISGNLVVGGQIAANSP